MSVRFKPSTAPFDLSTRNLEKFIATQKNLSRPTPKLWSDSDKVKLNAQDNNGVPILQLSHPVLQILELIGPNLRHFNQVHGQLIVLGLIDYPLAASRAIKKLCSFQATLPHAVKFFNNLKNPDAFLCNTIIRGFLKFDSPERALTFYYNGMVKNGIFQNHHTFPTVVKACADLASLKHGVKIHGQAVKCGFQWNLYVRNSLIHLYAICSRIEDATKVFDMSSDSDLVTWNTMIDGYVKNGEVNIARDFFDRMQERDIFSWNSMISGYAGIGNMMAAKELFENMPNRDIVSWNSMIEGYAKIGEKDGARFFFNQMRKRNVVSLNTMLALYVRLKAYDECLKLFDRMMQLGDVHPNEATLVSVLTSCAHLGKLDRGKWIHSYIKSSASIKPDVLLMTTLLSMFSKCGAVDLAEEVFDDMPERSVVTWNSMITAYGIHGQGDKALEIFMEMQKRAVIPNEATFTCILSACNHGGMVLEGWWYFDLMQRVYKIEPKVEHYGCMVDLLGRAGLMKDCEELVMEIPAEAGKPLWGALLSACRTHSRLRLGEIVAKHLINMEPRDMGPYVLLSNIYATEGRWDDVEYVRKMMKEKGTEKIAGSSMSSVTDSKFDLCSTNKSAHKKSILYCMMSEMGTKLKLS